MKTKRRILNAQIWRLMSVFVILGLALSMAGPVQPQVPPVRILISSERTPQWEEIRSAASEQRLEIELVAQEQTELGDVLMTMIAAGDMPHAAEVSQDIAEMIAIEIPDMIFDLKEVSETWPELGIVSFEVKGMTAGLQNDEGQVLILFAVPWERYELYDFLDVIYRFFRRNPPLNSAVSAHGNTDWHIDTANEFLFGVDNSGTPSAANHCPDTWTRTHMHVGLANTADFYYDRDLIATGADTDATNGIETAMLFFYAGHGDPDSWDTLGNSATQTNMSLGDYSWLDPGLLRYYWQCSCEVFAHGPSTCAGTTELYACPGDWDGSADSPNMRNVYERWGPVLQPDLRMACGVSTLAYCHEWQTNRIWDDYNNLNMDVADSFIDGLKGSPWPVPLCITRGGPFVFTSPLVTDTRFTNAANTAGTTFYHIQYLDDFASNPPFFWIDIRPPEQLVPIWELWPPPPPDPVRDVRFEAEGDFLISPEQVSDRGPLVRINRLSGAVYMLGERQQISEEPVLEEQEYIERALRFIEEQGWTEEQVAEPMGERFVIEVTPIEGSSKDTQRFQKNVIVTFRRQIDVGGTTVNVLGEGGEMRVQMNNDGSILNASKVWRQLGDVKERAPVKTYDEAYEEALKQIGNPEAYDLDHWAWGYKEEAGNVEQTELRIVYQFWFVPVNNELALEFPPQMIEILGHPQ